MVVISVKNHLQNFMGGLFWGNLTISRFFNVGFILIQKALLRLLMHERLNKAFSLRDITPFLSYNTFQKGVTTFLIFFSTLFDILNTLSYFISFCRQYNFLILACNENMNYVNSQNDHFYIKLIYGRMSCRIAVFQRM